MTDKTNAELVLESIEWLIPKMKNAVVSQAEETLVRAGNFDGVTSFTVDALMTAAAKSKVWTLIEFELDSNEGKSAEDKLRAVFDLCRRQLLSHWATQSSSWSAAGLRDLELQEWAHVLRTYEPAAEL